MSAFAMFSLKAPSLFAFDKSCKEKMINHNLETLYGIKRAPCDTYMRTELDKVDPTQIRKCFLSIFKAIQRGNVLKSYSFLDGYLILVDGTGIFDSETISCENCCEKHHRDGKITYYHQLLVAAIAHPDQRQVIPLCPEPISKKDGMVKNDCEQRATRRFLTDLKKEHPQLQGTIVCDALSATTPQINEIKSLGYHFIINVKPGNNKTLFEFVEAITLSTKIISVGKNHYTFRYINGVPLNNAKGAPLVNFLECVAIEVKGGKTVKRTFTWATDHKITDDKVYLIMRGGRARWKVENETFNTLKNQGYQLEHNFGHGKKNLMTVFAMLMMLAFLIDQVQEAACGLFQAALQKRFTRRSLWGRMQSYFYTYFINSWEDLFTAIIQATGAHLIVSNTS